MEEDISTDLTVLQGCLDEVLDKIENDKQVLKQFQAFQLRLLTLHNLSEILEHILTDLIVFFSLDDISLSLVDEGSKIAQYLNESDYKNSNNVILLEDKLILSNELANGEYIGAYEHNKHQVFFPSRDHQPKEIAIFPLRCRGEFFGSLNLASNKKHRFVHSTVMEFTPTALALITLSLENCFIFSEIKKAELQKTLAASNNRQYLELRLTEELERNQRSVECISCLILEIKIQKSRKVAHVEKLETYVMKIISEVIKQQLRVSDVFSYYEGKKFAALLVNVSKTVVLQVEKRIETVLAEQHLKFSGQMISVSATFGYASENIKAQKNQNHSEMALELIKRADEDLMTTVTALKTLPVIKSSLKAKRV